MSLSLFSFFSYVVSYLHSFLLVLLVYATPYPYPLPSSLLKMVTALSLHTTRAEAGCCKVMNEVRNHREAMRAIQEAEEKLTKDLGSSGLTAVFPELRQTTDEYLSVVMEVRLRHHHHPQ